MEDYEYKHNSMEEKIEHEFQDNIICPYCGCEYEYEKSREMIGNTTNAWKFDVECRKCAKMFSASWNYSNDDEGEETEDIEFWTYHEDQSDFV